jgi:hypothetical protein
VAAAARDVPLPLVGQLPRELPFITQSCIDAGIASVEAAYTAALALCRARKLYLPVTLAIAIDTPLDDVE